MGSTIRVELETQDAGCPTGRTGRIQIRGFESLPAFAVRGVPWRPRYAHQSEGPGDESYPYHGIRTRGSVR